MNFLAFLILVAFAVLWVIHKKMATLEPQSDDARIAEAQRQHAKVYRAFEQRERQRAMQRR